jgi:hypothetical protein
MTSRDFEEKRSFVRMQVETQVSFTIKGEQEKTYHGVSQDLSATGLLMSSEHALETGDQIDIVMNSGNERFPPFVSDGTVTRVIADEKHPGRYLISVALSRAQ